MALPLERGILWDALNPTAANVSDAMMPLSSASEGKDVTTDPPGCEEEDQVPAVSVLCNLLWQRQWEAASQLIQHTQDTGRVSKLPCFSNGASGLPLHLVCAMRPIPPFFIVEMILKKHPGGARQKASMWGLLPLHLAADLRKPAQPPTLYHHQIKKKKTKQTIGTLEKDKDTSTTTAPTAKDSVRWSSSSSGGEEATTSAAADDSLITRTDTGLSEGAASSSTSGYLSNSVCSIASPEDTMLASPRRSKQQRNTTTTSLKTDHSRVVQLLIEVFPRALYAPEEFQGMLPLHIAASSTPSVDGKIPPSSAQIVELLIRYAPDTLGVKDHAGDTPIVLAQRSSSTSLSLSSNQPVVGAVSHPHSSTRPNTTNTNTPSDSTAQTVVVSLLPDWKLNPIVQATVEQAITTIPRNTTSLLVGSIDDLMNMSSSSENSSECHSESSDDDDSDDVMMGMTTTTTTDSEREDDDDEEWGQLASFENVLRRELKDSIRLHCPTSSSTVLAPKKTMTSSLCATDVLSRPSPTSRQPQGLSVESAITVEACPMKNAESKSAIVDGDSVLHHHLQCSSASLLQGGTSPQQENDQTSPQQLDEEPPPPPPPPPIPEQPEGSNSYDTAMKQEEEVVEHHVSRMMEDDDIVDFLTPATTNVSPAASTADESIVAEMERLPHVEASLSRELKSTQACFSIQTDSFETAREQEVSFTSPGLSTSSDEFQTNMESGLHDDTGSIPSTSLPSSTAKAPVPCTIELPVIVWKRVITQATKAGKAPIPDSFRSQGMEQKCYDSASPRSCEIRVVLDAPVVMWKRVRPNPTINEGPPPTAINQCPTKTPRKKHQFHCVSDPPVITWTRVSPEQPDGGSDSSLLNLEHEQQAAPISPPESSGCTTQASEGHVGQQSSSSNGQLGSRHALDQGLCSCTTKETVCSSEASDVIQIDADLAGPSSTTLDIDPSPSSSSPPATPAAPLSELMYQLQRLQEENKAYNQEVERLRQQVSMLSEIKGVAVNDIRATFQASYEKEETTSSPAVSCGTPGLSPSRVMNSRNGAQRMLPSGVVPAEVGSRWRPPVASSGQQRTLSDKDSSAAPFATTKQKEDRDELFRDLLETTRSRRLLEVPAPGHQDQQRILSSTNQPISLTLCNTDSLDKVFDDVWGNEPSHCTQRAPDAASVPRSTVTTEAQFHIPVVDHDPESFAAMEATRQRMMLSSATMEDIVTDLVENESTNLRHAAAPSTKEEESTTQVFSETSSKRVKVSVFQAKQDEDPPPAVAQGCFGNSLCDFWSSLEVTECALACVENFTATQQSVSSSNVAAAAAAAETTVHGEQFAAAEAARKERDNLLACTARLKEERRLLKEAAVADNNDQVTSGMLDRVDSLIADLDATVLGLNNHISSLGKWTELVKEEAKKDAKLARSTMNPPAKKTTSAAATTTTIQKAGQVNFSFWRGVRRSTCL